MLGETRLNVKGFIIQSYNTEKTLKRGIQLNETLKPAVFYFTVLKIAPLANTP
ncbi:hypothetical protein CPS_1460 [Colwellia psychrerythraea 34H]|uniref:Uncharacterized protein n=1 Tax=Colwellia psychrerythraea (strain 34H / ATCC BAA-681) TaxID=167879 RepID=Q485R3_COLP3|nr:hypothetical protein CPS_1460 [Colwellia psychrerythraea 34H]